MDPQVDYAVLRLTWVYGFSAATVDADTGDTPPLVSSCGAARLTGRVKSANDTRELIIMNIFQFAQKTVARGGQISSRP